MKKHLIIMALLLNCFIAIAQTESCPCCTADHKAFDFWLGSWEVTNTDGTAAGENTIVKEQNGCVLKENWTSASPGFTGTSTNYFNLRTKQWEQLWVDNTGNNLKLKGKREGNQMILSSDAYKRPDGKLYINRISWTLNEDGTVRQLWEVLQNDVVVNIAFDGLYRKIK